MSNMSYCRFQNTAADLDDCHDALEAVVEECGATLSADELRAAQRLVKSCAAILALISETTDISCSDIITAAIDTNAVEKALAKLNEGSEMPEEADEANDADGEL